VRASERACTFAQEQKPRRPPIGHSWLPDWNATSHADPQSHGCPSAVAMHFGGADLTVALHR